MSPYKKILLAVDLNEGSEVIGERAKSIAACYQADIHFLHVVEYVPVEPLGETLLPAVQIEGELTTRAKKKLAELVERLGLSHCEQIVETGTIKGEIIRIA